MTEEKIFTCDMCGKSFSKKKDCLEHEKNHESACSITEQKFAYRDMCCCKYPQFINVRMSDGALKPYSYYGNNNPYID